MKHNNLDYELNGASRTPVEGNLRALAALFPSVVREGKVDFDALKQCLGEENLAEPGTSFGLQWFVTRKTRDGKQETRDGKQEARNAANIASLGTLRPCREDSEKWDSTGNLYIEGDNLEVLRLLQRSYHGRVKMIYIDPPYNTGKDFVYKDNFHDGLRAYREQTDNGDFGSNQNTDGRYHSNWLSMMYPRLVLARELLTDDGVIFVSIDDHEQGNLRKVCDEIFGESNFVANLIWERAYSPKNDARYISNSHDYVLMYAKLIDNFVIGRLDRTEEANARYSNPDNDPRGVWKASDMSVKTYNVSCDYPITTPSGRIVEPPAGRCWSLSRNAFRERLQDNRIWFGPNGDGVPAIKRFLSELKFDGMAPTSILFYKDVGHSQEGAKEVTALFGDKGVFDGPKPVRLLQRLIVLANLSEEDIVLDFFSGSATTAHAVMQLNAEDGSHRRFIMVQLPETCPADSAAAQAGYKTICDIGKERIRRAGAKIRAEHPEWEGDTGFRVYKLDGTNLRRWIPDVAELQEELPGFVDHLLPGRSSDDLLAELLLKRGLDLCSPSETLRTAAGTEIHCFGYGDSYVCLAVQLSPQEAEAVACLMVGHKLGVDPNGENSCAILLDAAFCGDDAAKLNLVTALKQQGNFMKVNFI